MSAYLGYEILDSYTCTMEDEEAGSYAYARLQGNNILPYETADLKVKYNGDIYDLSLAWAIWVYDSTHGEAEIHRNQYMPFYDGDEIELIQVPRGSTSTQTVVTFNANGGTGGPGTITYTTGVVGDEYYVGDNIPTKTNCTFLGWYDAQTGGEDVWDSRGFFMGGSYGEAPGDSFHDIWTYTGSTLTVWAHWESSTYSITYSNLNGATVNNPSEYDVSSQTFTLNNPTLTGHEFLGWTGSNGDTPQLSVSIPTGSTGNKNFKANWNPEYIYKVCIHTEGGFSDSNGSTNDIELEFTGLDIEDQPIFTGLDFVPITYSYLLAGIYDQYDNKVFDEYGQPVEGTYFDPEGRWKYINGTSGTIELYAIWNNEVFIYDDTKRRFIHTDNTTNYYWQDDLTLTDA